MACQELIQGRGILESFADNQQLNVLSLLAFLGLISAVTLHLLYDWYFPYPPSLSSTNNEQLNLDSDQEWGYTAAKAYAKADAAAAYLKDSKYPLAAAAAAAVKQPKRIWNLNDFGESPFGFGRNAETWNGRIAMVCCCDWLLCCVDDG